MNQPRNLDYVKTKEAAVLAAHPETRVVGFEQLFSEISAGSGFTLEQLLRMAAEQDDMSEGLFLNHGDELFFVPPEKLREFFETHEKPKRRMTVKQENEALKSQLAEMKAELERLKGKSLDPEKPKFQGTTAADLLKASRQAPRAEVPEDILDDDLPSDAKPAEMAPEALQTMLKAQVRNVKPFTTGA